MKHECQQDDLIRKLTTRVDKLEERMDTVKDDIKYLKDLIEKFGLDNKSFQLKVLFGTIAILLTSCGTLLVLLLKVKGLG